MRQGAKVKFNAYSLKYFLMLEIHFLISENHFLVLGKQFLEIQHCVVLETLILEIQFLRFRK